MGDSREEKVILIEKILQKRPDSRRTARFNKLLNKPEEMALYLDMVDLKASLSSLFKKPQIPNLKTKKDQQ